MDKEGPSSAILSGHESRLEPEALSTAIAALPSTHLSPRSRVARYVLIMRSTMAERLQQEASGLHSIQGAPTSELRRASIIISLADRKGALGDVLSTFSSLGISLSKIESFPAGDARAYLAAAAPEQGSHASGLHSPVFRFFVEAIVDATGSALLQAAHKLRTDGARVRIVGMYSQGTPATT